MRPIWEIVPPRNKTWNRKLTPKQHATIVAMRKMQWMTEPSIRACIRCKHNGMHRTLHSLVRRGWLEMTVHGGKLLYRRLK